MKQHRPGKSASSVDEPVVDKNTQFARRGGGAAGAGNSRRSGAEPAVAGPLGTSETAFHPVTEPVRQRVLRQDSRARKMRLRQDLGRITPHKSFRSCGHRACSASGVGVRLSETKEGRRAGFAGLVTCGSVWLCPVCAAKIAARRADELGTVMGTAHARGYQLALVTLTVRHRRTDSLRAVWGAVSAGWNRVTAGKAWLSDKRRWNIGGWVRAVEVTHGKHGWHVHIHSVVAYEGTEGDATALSQRMYTRWESGLRRNGFDAVPGYGVDVEVSRGGLGQLGAYLSKLGADLDGLSREVTGGSQKQGRGQNRTPFQIGRDAVDTGDADDIATWEEWCRTAPGHRALTWSKGFRDEFGLTDEETDEAVASEETGTEADTILVMPSETWRCVRSTPWTILEIAEDRGAEGLGEWLSSQGLRWETKPEVERADRKDLEELRKERYSPYAASGRYERDMRRQKRMGASTKPCRICREEVASELRQNVHVLCRTSERVVA